MSQWEKLFDQAVSIIRQANSPFSIVDDWTFGGGTALMLQIGHRESFDIDIFIEDPQVLPFLNPWTQGYTLEIDPDEYQTDGIRALRIIFAGIGEIDYICAPSLTEEPVNTSIVRGTKVSLETPAEIIAKKIYYRGASLQPRDMFDIACVAKYFGNDYVIENLLPFKDKTKAALAVAEEMDGSFARTIMGKLLCREEYSEIAGQAQATTIALFKAVCGSAPEIAGMPQHHT